MFCLRCVDLGMSKKLASDSRYLVELQVSVVGMKFKQKHVWSHSLMNEN